MVIKTKSVYKDYTGLLDTLKIQDERATMTAWADTSKNILAGKLEVQPSENRTRIEYKDREVHDTLYLKEPYPVEVEKVVAPKLYPWSLAFNFLVLAIIGIWIWFKTKSKLKI